MKNQYKCKCGGKLQVVQEVYGSFIYDVDENGEFDWDDKDFHGDIKEFVMCSECEDVIDATINPNEYIEFED